MTLRRWIKRGLLGLAAVVRVDGLRLDSLLAGRHGHQRRFAFSDRENAGLTPASFQLAFEDVAFQAPDGVALKGWWVPRRERARARWCWCTASTARASRWCARSRSCTRLGWNTLLFDLRAPRRERGRRVELRLPREARMCRARPSRSRAGAAPGPVVALGRVAGRAPRRRSPPPRTLPWRPSSCDSSYRSLRDTVAHHFALFRGFRWWLRAGARVARCRPRSSTGSAAMAGSTRPPWTCVAAAARLAGRPALFVCNSGDRRMPHGDRLRAEAGRGRSARACWWCRATATAGAYREGTAAYQSAVRASFWAGACAVTPALASARCESP